MKRRGIAVLALTLIMAVFFTGVQPGTDVACGSNQKGKDAQAEQASVEVSGGMEQAAQKKTAQKKTVQKKAAQKKTVQKKAAQKKTARKTAVSKKKIKQKKIRQKKIKQKKARVKKARQKRIRQKKARQKKAKQKRAARKRMRANRKRARKAGLKTFKSYKKIGKYVKSVRKAEAKRREQFFKEVRQKYVSNDDVLVNEEVPVMMDKSAPVKANSDGAAASASGESHSQTYTQVKGVDEGDVVKTDGKYIYYITGEEIVIALASQGKTKRTAAISINDAGRYDWFEEIYLKGSKLIIIKSRNEYVSKRGRKLYSDSKTARAKVNKNGEIPRYYDPGSKWQPKQFTSAVIYDISDRRKPKKTGEYSQSGYYVSSRMIDDHLYLVTDDYVSEYQKFFVPLTIKKGKLRRLAAGNISSFPNTKSVNYAVVGSVDVQSGKKVSSITNAVLGASTDIFCSQKNLYLANSVYGYYYDTYNWGEDDDRGYGGSTKLIKAGLNNGMIVFNASGKVKGRINDQFSMDEYDGYFRVTTTGRTKDGKDINHLYILNPKMKVVGETEPFAEDEHIEAARFLGKKAYIITYEETDPLFIVDLSDPKKPEIKGEAKITGFSTLLHPVSETRLLGIGYATEDGGDIGMEIQNGIKLVLFDVEKDEAPKVLNAKVFRNLYSEAQNNHRAFVVNGKKDYYAIPYEDYDDNGGAIVFRIKNDKIKIEKKWKGRSSVQRCLYIGDYIYTIGYDGKLDSFKM